MTARGFFGLIICCAGAETAVHSKAMMNTTTEAPRRANSTLRCTPLLLIAPFLFGLCDQSRSRMHIFGKPDGRKAFAYSLSLCGRKDVLSHCGELQPCPDGIEEDYAFLIAEASSHSSAHNVGKIRCLQGE